MLQEPAEDGPHRDRLGHPWDARPQHADRTGADLDRDARLGSGVELFDHERIDELVQLESDACCLTGGRRCGHTADLLDQPRPHRERSDKELAEPLWPAEAGEVVEEIGDIGRDVLVGSEQPHVLVPPRGRRVVVAGADVDVATEYVTLAPHDERHLCVDLEIGKAVHDVDTRLLHLARPLDVPPLVETRFELHEAHRLLPLLGAVDQRADENAVVAGAVHGRLDRDHVRVARGSLDERFEARPERLVRLLHEQIAAADLVEEPCAVLRSGEPWLRDGDPRLVLQLGTVDDGDLAEVGEVELALDLVHLIGVDTEAGHQPVEHCTGRRGGDLQPDHVAETAPAEFQLDGFEEVVRVVRHFEVGVARHPERRALGDLHPREQRRQEVRDDALQRDESRLATHLDEPRQAFGHLHAGEALFSRDGVHRDYGERQGQPRDVRERLARTDAERREDGVDLTLVATGELLELLLAALLEAEDRDPFGLERRP